MFYRVFLFGVLSTFLFSLPISGFAASGHGKMASSIIDPLRMSLEEAKRLCREEPQLVKCDVLQETLIEKDIKATKKHSYHVLTANFE